MMPQTERAFPKLDALEAAARGRGRLSVAVAYPCSADSLAAALSAREDGMIEPVLVGPRQRIEACASILKVSLEGLRFVEAEDDPIISSRTAVALVGAGEASALMKGSQHTDELLGSVVSRDANMRTSRRMSHVFWFDLPAYHKPLMVTDAVVNITPSLKDKVDILANAIRFAQAIGLAAPKIALLSAIETVSPDHVSSMDAAALSKMAERGQISGAVHLHGARGMRRYCIRCARADHSHKPFGLAARSHRILRAGAAQPALTQSGDKTETARS